MTCIDVRLALADAALDPGVAKQVAPRPEDDGTFGGKARLRTGPVHHCDGPTDGRAHHVDPSVGVGQIGRARRGCMASATPPQPEWPRTMMFGTSS